MENKFKAVVKSAATFTGTKSNGGSYVLHQVEILDGPFKGLSVPGTRTVLNSKGEKKEPVAEGQEVTVYHRVEPKADGNGNKHFFEISTGEMSASDAELDAIMAKAVAQTV